MCLGFGWPMMGITRVPMHSAGLYRGGIGEMKTTPQIKVSHYRQKLYIDTPYKIPYR
jgi:hypothetical protein